MNIKQNINFSGLLMACLLLAVGFSCSTKKSEVPPFYDEAFQKAATQYHTLGALLEPDQFPKTYENGRLVTSNSGWWCSGFYPGSLIYLYEQTGDSSLLYDANKMLKSLEVEQYNKTTHDLGFMMFCSYGNANRVDPHPQYDSIILNSSISLASRFDSLIGCIRSWDAAPWNSKWQYPVIIDNMMNLEMLMWAADRFNRLDLRQVAITHANTTMENHFRPDFSSYHVVSYDTLTGAVEMKNTDQGFADESSWARGQSWGLYGFTVMYRFTEDPKYLSHALGIADYLIHHPNLPADKIPYWDYNDPAIPNAPRDASAAAVMASALLELSDYAPADKSAAYLETATQILKTLASDEYTAAPGTNGGFILMHSVGNKPDGTEVDVPLSYADYYYLEALKRLRESSLKTN